jgi:hypothetical protein
MPHPYGGGYSPYSFQPWEEQMKCPSCGLLKDHPVHDMTEGLSTHEPMPIADPARGDVQSLVIADIEERRRVGIARYGTPLQTFNGRNADIDLYQELLDAVMYQRQNIEERRTLMDLLREVVIALDEADCVDLAHRISDWMESAGARVSSDDKS